MRKNTLFLFFILFHFLTRSQVTLIGHNQLNNVAVFNTSIIVKSAGAVTQTLSTKSRADFKIQLAFGHNYQVYFQNAVGPVMYMEVIANTVPSDKYQYMMTYEMNVPFVSKKDEDVDTAVFVKPFYRILFNGNNRMVDDSAYNNKFAASIIKHTFSHGKSGSNLSNEKYPVVLSGKILASADNSINIFDKPIKLISKNGQVLKSTYTNRFGAFSFTGVSKSDARLIKLELTGVQAGQEIAIVNNDNKIISQTKSTKDNCEWLLNDESMLKLLDNNFTTNIGGKLIASSSREKRFFSEQTVYLTNKMNTVLRKTKTNLFGTFAFEDIKPDNVYFICVDKNEIPPGARIDLLNKEDRFIATLDTITAGRKSLKFYTNYNQRFNELTIGDDEMKMDVKATIFGDNVNNPIGKLKILLLNDNYEVIDSAITDNFGTFKFKYLPFLKRFYLSAENTDNVLDVFKNILIYSSDDNLIKIMTHQKGTRFTYIPLSAEMSSMRDIEIEDPWLELVGSTNKEAESNMPELTEKKPGSSRKLIVENILFEPNRTDISPQAKEVLDKVVLVLDKNQSLRIEVGAHTDSKGSAEANLKLSEMRAKTVREYIISSGIDHVRVLSRGYGETKLLNHCDDTHSCTEKEHAQNRRIEFRILGEKSNENH